ncbi:type II secretion system F family protein [Apilactobacillus xinyiensis]|nr:type II secretion system F family protein [Apilactobacillus xinyiensis]
MNFYKIKGLVQRFITRRFYNHKMSLFEQAYLFKKLNELLLVGFSISEAIDFLCKIGKNSKLNLVKLGMSNGYSFSYSIRKLINNNFYNQLLVSEKNGSLIETLNSLGAFTKALNNYNKKLKSILVYPAILAVMLVLVVFLISNVIIPQMNSVDSYLFSPVSSLLGIAVILICIIVLISGLYYLLERISPINKVTLITQIPFLGNVYLKYLSYQLSINLSLFLNSGLDIRNIIVVIKKFEKNTIVYQLAVLLDNHLNNGKSYVEFIHKYNFIPNEYIIFINQGLSNVELARQFEAFADLSFENMDKKINRLINAVQPLIFLIIGIVIIITYLSILLPVYQSMKGI